MKNLVIVLAVAALAICAASAVCGDPIDLSENWYIKITNFSLQGSFVSFEDFSRIWSYKYSTTSSIEPKLQYPASDGESYSTLIFDFHAGQASLDDKAWFDPLATLGTSWGATMSFDWEIHCNDPRVIFGVDGVGTTQGVHKVWWTVPVGGSYRSGSTSLGVSTYLTDTPNFYVSFAEVPEPTGFVALLVPISLSGIGIRLRRTKA
jgi:hypothetical protein